MSHVSAPHDRALPARIAALRARALEWERRGAVEEGESLLDAAAEVAGLGTSSPGVAAEQAHTLAALGLVAHRRGDVRAALSRYLDASTLFGGAHAVPLALEARIAFARYDLGEHDAARAALVGLWRRAREADQPGAAGIALGYLGNVARARGAYGAARRAWDGAHRELRRAGDRLFAAAFAMDEAIGSLLRGEDHAASLRLEAAADDAEARAHWYLPTLVAHYQVLARLRTESVRDVAIETPETELARFLHDVRALGASIVRAPRGHHGDAIATLATRAPAVEHARVGIAWLRARLEDAHAPGPTLVVDDDGRVVEWAGATIDLSSLGAPRRLLLALVEAHRAGAALSIDALAARVWPGERLLPASARNRVHVALSTLRSAGLRAAVERTVTASTVGYRLNPAIRVVTARGAARR